MNSACCVDAFFKERGNVNKGKETHEYEQSKLIKRFLREIESSPIPKLSERVSIGNSLITKYLTLIRFSLIQQPSEMGRMSKGRLTPKRKSILTKTKNSILKRGATLFKKAGTTPKYV